VWDTETGELLLTLRDPESSAFPTMADVMFSPDGRRVVSLSNYGVVRLWGTAPGYEPARAAHGPAETAAE
jgi:WD40 repeat protein